MKVQEYPNLDTTNAYRGLRNYALLSLKELLTEERIQQYIADAGGGLRFSYAGAPIDKTILRLLQELSSELGALRQYEALASGEIMNPGEKRKVLHHLCRGELAGPVTEEGKNLRSFYLEEQERFSLFADKVRRGVIKGSTGKDFDTVVQIGIGGSDLGPRALYMALENYALKKGLLKLKSRFISNVDPDDAYEVLENITPETTLFILVSKSGTTQETLANYHLVLEKIRACGIPALKPEKHMIAVTSKGSPLSESPDFLDSFYINDYIGGRYSSTSAVGGVILSLSFGPDIFSEILKGAHDADQTAMNKKIANNAALLDACIGIYYRNILSYPCLAVLPYSHALRRFSAHLQQLDMESNGKMVNRRGEFLSHKTGPVIFGEPGTNGQHSFYQLLHQGTDNIPLEFILFEESQSGFDCVLEGSTNQEKLRANCIAQISAFTGGQENEDYNRFFPGERPCTLLFGKQLTPEALGALLAHFENKVMFQGFLWNINSFDQEGVQLGKVLTEKILKGAELPPVLKGYASVLGLV